MRTVVVIGSGFSGSMTAVQLIRASRGMPVRLVVVERGARFGPGLAYGAGPEGLLLNVVAGRMSAFPDDPGHFHRWAKARRPDVTGEMFLPRREYGRYIADTLAEAERSVTAPMVFERMVDEVVAVDEPSPDGTGMVVRMKSGADVRADAVVLATGNFPPSDPSWARGELASSGRYVGNPWEGGGLALIQPTDRVLVMGTGLTMMDIVLTLRERGHRGTIVAVSRRGLMPQAHREPIPGRAKLPEPLFRHTFSTTLELVRALRAEVKREVSTGGDWRDVVNAMRPVTPALWMALGEREQQRFLEHLLPFWSTHRHRAPPAVAEGVNRLLEQGTLSVVAGRIVSAALGADGVTVTVLPRGAADSQLLREKVDHVINCTGPTADVRRVDDPLMKSLLSRGVVVPGPLGMGLRMDDSGAAIGADGSVNRAMVIVGPARIGKWFEATAAPELRTQALKAAEHLVAHLGSMSGPAGAVEPKEAREGAPKGK